MIKPASNPTVPPYQQDFVSFFKSPVVHIYKPWITKFNTTRAVILSYLAVNGPVEKNALQDNLALSKAEVHANTKALINEKAIRQVHQNPYEIKKIICKKQPQSGVGDMVCEWCKGETIYLHNHHFPILASHGGKETVAICPNCHMEFHYLHRKVFYEIMIDIPDELKGVHAI